MGVLQKFPSVGEVWVFSGAIKSAMGNREENPLCSVNACFFLSP